MAASTLGCFSGVMGCLGPRPLRRQAGETGTIQGQLWGQANQSSEGWTARGLLQARGVHIPGEPHGPWYTPIPQCLCLVQRRE